MNEPLIYVVIRRLFPRFDYAFSRVPYVPGRMPLVDTWSAEEGRYVSRWVRVCDFELVFSVRR